MCLLKGHGQAPIFLLLAISKADTCLSTVGTFESCRNYRTSGSTTGVVQALGSYRKLRNLHVRLWM